MTMARWTDEEYAFILTYADLCLRNGDDYRSTVAKELQPITIRPITFKKVADQLTSFLRKYKVGRTTYRDVIEKGTKAFEGVKLDAGLADTCDKFGLEWGIGTLSQRGDVMAKLGIEAAGPGRHMARKNNATKDAARIRRPPQKLKARREQAVGGIGGHGKVLPVRAERRSNSQQFVSSSSEREESSESNYTRNGSQQSTMTRDLQSPTMSLLTPPSASASRIEGTHNGIDISKEILYLRNELQASDMRNQAMQKSLSDVLAWVIRQNIVTKHELPTNIFTTMRSIHRTIGEDPGQAFGVLTRELCLTDQKWSDCRKTLRDLIGTTDCVGRKLSHPQELPKEVAQTGWRLLRNLVQDATRFSSFLTAPGSVITTGAFAFAQLNQLIGNGIEFSGDLSTWLSGLNIPIEDPRSCQAVVAIAVCCLAFLGRETMCPQDCWRAAVKMYEPVALQDGVEEVRRLDRITTQCWFKDTHFRDVILPQRIETFQTRLGTFFNLLCAKFPPTDIERTTTILSEDKIRELLELKQSLMTCSCEYRIHFALPRTVFDADWMVAEDLHGQKIELGHCLGRRVVLCLFPALVRCPSSLLAKDAGIPAALLQHKRFFPSCQGATVLGPADIAVEKAVVVLE